MDVSLNWSFQKRVIEGSMCCCRSPNMSKHIGIWQPEFLLRYGELRGEDEEIVSLNVRNGEDQKWIMRFIPWTSGPVKP